MCFLEVVRHTRHVGDQDRSSFRNSRRVQADPNQRRRHSDLRGLSPISQVHDRSVVIRSVVGCKDRHESYQCLSGWFPDDLRAIGGRPSIGSSVAKLLRADRSSRAALCGIGGKDSARPLSDPGNCGFLGCRLLPLQA